MSFRLFVYCSALCGAWAALVGWGVGRALGGEHPLASAGLKAMYLGTFVALALGIIDVLWTYSLRQVRQVLPRALTATLGGAVGGLLGGLLGQVLFEWQSQAAFFILGWTITGLLIGLSIVLFDLALGFIYRGGLHKRMRKVWQAVGGGAAGGLLGGLLALQLKDVGASLFPHAPQKGLWTPTAWGFVVLGLCIGLMIGLAQVLFKERWLRFEAGRRKGREMFLSKPLLTIGRAEACDIGLFGDPRIERLHARLELDGDGFLVTDVGTPAGTYVNGRRIDAPTRLRSGDVIGVSSVLLRFEERQKRNS
jgi:hypothetical protein